VAVLFLIAAQAALQAQASARSRVGLRDNSPADAVRCIPRAVSPVVRRRVLAPALASVPASVLVLALVSAQVWVALLDSFRPRVRLHVRSVRVARLVAAVRPTKRVKKAR
jgi:hypothetical protein